jgi:hypothetical protein
MPIKINKAVSTKERIEFRCLGRHNEWYLYRANKLLNGDFELSNSPAGKRTVIDTYSTLTRLFKEANAHANCL